MHFYKTSCVQLIMESVLSGLFAFAAPEIQDYFQFKTLLLQLYTDIIQIFTLPCQTGYLVGIC